MVLWGGNNEVEASFGWYNETQANMPLYALDYDALFTRTVGSVLQQVCHHGSQLAAAALWGTFACFLGFAATLLLQLWHTCPVLSHTHTHLYPLCSR